MPSPMGVDAADPDIKSEQFSNIFFRFILKLIYLTSHIKRLVILLAYLKFSH